jgi:organic hydroperoxide reductase OsmC/OhrA
MPNNEMKKHNYQTKITWTGNEGKGTKNYSAYNRNHSISAEGKYGEILSSSDPSFRGDKTRFNPEELFLSSISSCHMLWYLHLCSTHKITVIDYVDNASGTMEEGENGSGRFAEVTLNPIATILEEHYVEKAKDLHKEASQMCFIANSVNFKIGHLSEVNIKE